MRMRVAPLLLAAAVLMLRPTPGIPQPVGRGAAAGPPGGLSAPGALAPATAETPDWAGPGARWGNPGAPWPGPGVLPGNRFGPGSDRARGRSDAALQRRARAAALRSAHREQLDLDPDGNLVVRGTLVGMTGAPRALEALVAAGFVLERQEGVEGLASPVVVLAVPRGMSLRDGLKALHHLDPDGTYDYDHIYFESGDAAAPQGQHALDRPAVSATAAASPRRVGLLDGGVETDHPALRTATLLDHGCNGRSIPSPHGTATASRLLDGMAGASPAAPRVALYVADVYCGLPAGGSADAVIDGLAWLVQQEVPVINVSLVGPPNALLQRVVEAATSRGYLIVAAVGNDGPASPPLYPAAYPGVVAVTGVDRSDKALLEAGRGPWVAFAAPGADISAASLPDGYAPVRGTSFAAPVVAGRLALLLDHPDPAAAARAVATLAAGALDLGTPGRDPVYGNGCIGCRRPASAVHSAGLH